MNRRPPHHLLLPAVVAVAAGLLVPGCRKPQEPVDERYLRFMNLGKAHYDNRAAGQAVEAFEKAVALLPAEIPARLNLARAYLLARREAPALRQAEEVLAIDRHSVAARYLAGIAQLRQGNAAQAVSHLELAARQDPSLAVIHFQLAAALKLDGQEARHVEELRTVLALDPNHWSAHYQLSRIAAIAGRQAEAREHLEAYQRIVQKLPEVKRSTEALEHCRYTEAEVPLRVHQPAPETIAVRFTALALIESNSEPSAVLAAIAADGRPELLLRGGEGRILRTGPLQNDALTPVRDALADIPAAAAARVADFDNDGLPDAYVFGPRSGRLLQQRPAGAFADATGTSGLTAGGGPDAQWVDYDHDSDLDLLTVEAGGTLRLWENRGNGTFTDQSAVLALDGAKFTVTSVSAVDLDGDEDVDLVLSCADAALRVLDNDGLGIFALRESPSWPPAGRFIAEDFDNDFRTDLAAARGRQLRVHFSAGKQQSIDLPGDVRQVQTIDYDNDGWLDLLVLSAGDAAGAVLSLYRNQGVVGWRDVSSSCGLTALRVAETSNVLVFDLDQDGDSDVVLDRADGLPLWLRNDGGSRHRQLKIALRGTKSNRSGIGTLIEIRSGVFRASRRVDVLPVEIGVGSVQQLESVRTIWPNGIVKNDIWVKTDEPLEVTEPLVSAGSCPYVYVWDGRRFRFVTDILGGAPVGLSLRRGVFIPADTDELVWLGDLAGVGQRDGRYAIQITDELREILYLDRVYLVVADHPPETEVHPTDKLQPPPFGPTDLRQVGGRLPLAAAHDDAGRDWTAALQHIDGVRSEPPVLSAPQLRGRALPHGLVLDFGRLDSAQPLILALTGWLMWGDASVNIAASQNPQLGNPWPQLHARVDGRWQPVPVVVGAPAGKTKTILVDLFGALPRGTTALRLSTAFEIYWDRIAMFSSQARVTRRTVREPIRARLFWRGFAKQMRPAVSAPIVPDTANMLSLPPYRSMPVGWCTRYGDVLELLQEVDDRFVIFNGGDAAVIEFDADLQPLPAGWSRQFFMFCDGWDKDSDYNVRHGNTVDPLPFHGMDDQRYGRQHRPQPPDDWMQRYNRRWVE